MIPRATEKHHTPIPTARSMQAAVKAQLDNYQHDYNERNFFFFRPS